MLRNRIIHALPDNERRELDAILVSGALHPDAVLYEVQSNIDTVYFPDEGIIALIVSLSTGQALQVAMVGHDGVLGAAAVLGFAVSLNRAVVQVRGQSQKCSVAALEKLLPHCPVLSRLLIGHEQALLMQLQLSGACNAFHPLESRLARWLLRAQDLHVSDRLLVTQEYMAQMLGSARTSLSLIATAMQKEGLLSYSRARIEIRDPARLKTIACECYETVRRVYNALGANNQ